MIKKKLISATGIKLLVEQDGRETARAYLYILYNDLHDKPFGFMEDVFVDESLRGQGVGTKLVRELIRVAREKGCYKIIGNSRYSREKVHDLYSKIGFKDCGKEFRIDL